MAGSGRLLVCIGLLLSRLYVAVGRVAVLLHSSCSSRRYLSMSAAFFSVSINETGSFTNSMRPISCRSPFK